jgi:hypothetical protein
MNSLLQAKQRRRFPKRHPQTKADHKNASFSNPSKMGQFREQSNRWVSFPEHRWVNSGERQGPKGVLPDLDQGYVKAAQ